MDHVRPPSCFSRIVLLFKVRDENDNDKDEPESETKGAPPYQSELLWDTSQMSHIPAFLELQVLGGGSGCSKPLLFNHLSYRWNSERLVTCRDSAIEQGDRTRWLAPSHSSLYNARCHLLHRAGLGSGFLPSVATDSWSLHLPGSFPQEALFVF